MKSKTTLLFLLLSIIGLSAFSQDLIMKNDLQNIEAKVIEITPSEIKYKSFSNLEGPLISILKIDVKMIKYENGELMYLNTGQQNTNIDMGSLGRQDAINNYRCVKCGATGTTITSFLSPILGLIPAVATSASYPKDFNLNEPNPEYMKNRGYQKAYNRQAKKMKQTKIWTGWGAGLLFNLAFSLITNSTANR